MPQGGIFSFWGCTSRGVPSGGVPSTLEYLWWSTFSTRGTQMKGIYIYMPQGASFLFEDVPLVEYLLFTRMPGESYRRRLGSLLMCLCDVFRALINSLVCWFCTGAPGLILSSANKRWVSILNDVFPMGVNGNDILKQISQITAENKKTKT